MERETSLYFHVPFCVRRCAYCDFTSYADKADRMEAYADALCREITLQGERYGCRKVPTVFFGGGTPTLLSPDQIGRILDTARAVFRFAPDCEITMEGNPGTVTAARLAGYRAAGVNRLSLGVQSLDDGLLRGIGRIHTAKEAREAVRMAREAGFDNLNLDLMYGLPGQSAAQWRSTLESAAAFSPEHLSCYSLIVEEGTRLAEQIETGACAPLPDEETMEEMDALTLKLTARAGYERYEVSNFARPGFACRHNIVYWECRDYLGLGCAAHSDMDGLRFGNPAGFSDYLAMAGDPNAAREAEDCSDRPFERMMMGLRMVRGVDIGRFRRDFGLSPEARWPESVPRLLREDLLRMGDGYLSLTARGMDVMNGVLVRLMEETERQKA